MHRFSWEFHSECVLIACSDTSYDLSSYFAVWFKVHGSFFVVILFKVLLLKKILPIQSQLRWIKITEGSRQPPIQTYTEYCTTGYCFASFFCYCFSMYSDNFNNHAFIIAVNRWHRAFLQLRIWHKPLNGINKFAHCASNLSRFCHTSIYEKLTFHRPTINTQQRHIQRPSGTWLNRNIFIFVQNHLISMQESVFCMQRSTWEFVTYYSVFTYFPSILYGVQVFPPIETCQFNVKIPPFQQNSHLIFLFFSSFALL